MTEINSLETEELLRLAEQEDHAAIRGLFERHRGRLRRMVAARLDRRVTSRLDASDVVQEALKDAGTHLNAFLRERPVPYYTWLRRLTLQRLAWLHRFHLGSQKRSASREQDLDKTISAAPVDSLAVTDSSPSQHLLREEDCARVRAAFRHLRPADREVLELCYFEQLSLPKVADRLGIGLSAVKMRQLRALRRFRDLVSHPATELSS